MKKNLKFSIPDDCCHCVFVTREGECQLLSFYYNDGEMVNKPDGNSWTIKMWKMPEDDGVRPDCPIQNGATIKFE